MQFKLLAAFTLLSTTFTSVLAQEPLKAPYFSGFNFGATKPDGSCKTTEDWKAEFAKVQTWKPNEKAKFNVAKIFSTADCDALARAVPAAISTKMKIWAGLWAVDAAKFTREKGALEAAIKKHGKDWLIGVSVGSESLYREEINPHLLAEYIYDVKGMVQIAYGIKVPVGCADTWTAWVDGRNAPVVQAVDVVLMNAFPYWQGSTPQNGTTVFRDAIWKTRKAIGTKKQIIIGETGWPTKGANFGVAKPSRANLQTYYTGTSCWLQNSGLYPWFWFSAFDQPERGREGVEGNFGIADEFRTPKVKFACP